MSGESDGRPVLKVGLRRMELSELLASEPALCGCELVRALDAPALTELCASAVVRRYPDGATVYAAGEAGGALFLVLRGEARLVVGRGENAVEVVAQRGEVFGEHEAQGCAAVRRAAALARGELDAAELPQPAVRVALERSALLRQYLVRLDAERAARCNELSEFLKRW